MMKRKQYVLIALATLMVVSMVATTVSVSAASPSSATVKAPVTGTPNLVYVYGVQGDNHWVFARGYDGALWYKYMNEPDWHSLGGYLTADPSGAATAGGRIDVFVRGTDGALWVKSSTDYGVTWGTWSSWGGYLAAGTGPAATAWTGGTTWQTRVFVVGSDLALWTKWMDNTNPQAWTSMGGVVTATPGAAVTSPGTVDVFVRGTGGAIWERVGATGGFTDWTQLPGNGVAADGTGPSAVKVEWGGLIPQSVVVFVQGTNGALFAQPSIDANGALWWTGTESGKNWVPLGGSLTSSPSAGKFDGFAASVVHVMMSNAAGDIWWTSGGGPWNNQKADWGGIWKPWTFYATGP